MILVVLELADSKSSARLPRSLSLALAFSLAFTLGRAVAAGAGETAAPAWGMYNKTYDSQRYSPLQLINRGNVSRLRPVCETEVGEMAPLQSGLLVVGRRLFLTTPRTTLAPSRPCLTTLNPCRTA